jgi:hypothetical protein
VQALSRVFRGKYLAALTDAFDQGQLALTGGTSALADRAAQQRFLALLRVHPWVVYAKSPMAGPEQVLEYLGRYAHRVALSNERLLSLDERGVRFLYKDYAHAGYTRSMALEPQEFIRRFLLHVLPRHFVRIRHYGLLGNRGKRRALAQCRAAMNQPSLEPTPQVREPARDFWLRVAAVDLPTCVHCGIGQMHLVRTLAPDHPPARAPPGPDAATTWLRAHD